MGGAEGRRGRARAASRGPGISPRRIAWGERRRQAAGGHAQEGDDDETASNTKLVFAVKSGLPELREKLLAAGVKMRRLKRYSGFAQLMCDGEDPEGNVFQLSQPD